MKHRRIAPIAFLAYSAGWCITAEILPFTTLLSTSETRSHLLVTILGQSRRLSRPGAPQRGPSRDARGERAICSTSSRRAIQPKS